MARTAEQEQLRQDVLLALTGGMSVADVSAEFDVPTATIYSWAKGYKIVAANQETKEKAICDDYTNLRELSIAKICAKHDIGQNTLYRYLAKHKIPNRTAKEEGADERDTETILAMYDAGVILSEIQRRTGRGFPFLYRILQAAGRRMRRGPSA